MTQRTMDLKAKHYLAIDIGASSGRIMHASFDGLKIQLAELHRFPNHMLHTPDGTPEGRLCWDVVSLWTEIKVGLRKAATLGKELWTSIGVDSWGVDYALIGKSGRLLANPTAYRDPRNQRSAQRVEQLLGRRTIYDATGIQFLPFNSLYQLADDALDPDQPLSRAQCFLMIPDLIHYWLCGEKTTEHSNASTTQMYDAETRSWVRELSRQVQIPDEVLPPIVDSGSYLGAIRQSLAEDVGLSRTLRVVAPATHDTGSAVAGTPLRDPQTEAYLSSGTWSLLGVEMAKSCRTQEAYAANFTNEAGAYGTNRFLTNRSGMWLVQECQREWDLEGKARPFDALVAMASESPALRTLINPDDPALSTPGKIPHRIREACRSRGHLVPEADASLARSIFDSLAIRYASTLDTIRSITGREIKSIRIVGGGAHNDLLNQLTASATGCPVSAGPTEATALGNAVVQMITAGDFRNLSQAREVVAKSVSIRDFEPDYHQVSQSEWQAARAVARNLEVGATL